MLRYSSTGIVFIFSGKLTSSSPASIIFHVSTQFLDGCEDNVNSDAVINDDMIGLITEAIGFPNISSSLGSDHSSRNEHGSSASSDVRKGQGPAQIISKWGRGHKLHLEFDSTWGPIGPNAQPLETQLGNIVKNGMMAPMTYLEWNYMSNELLDRIWTEVTV
ncbi:hypothetical protein QYF36_002295 [Acer negundo]|nr:hypothetical protein QYF36_002295 [Acer negundo]